MPSSWQPMILKVTVTMLSGSFAVWIIYGSVM